MMLIGILWAAFAPAILIFCACLLSLMLKKMKWLDRFSLNEKKHRWPRFIVSLVLVMLVPLSVWLPEKKKFDQYCAAHGTPIIFKKEKTDGFFLDDSTANSFGMRYLHEEGFSWIEARSIYNPKEYTRYEKNGGAILEKEIEKITAEFEVKSVFSEKEGISISEMIISRISTGEKLASAANINFDGGWAKWVFGAWGPQSCPSAQSNPEAFKKMYGLAKDTLLTGPKSPEN